MADFERYGDYDDREYDEEKRGSWFSLALKICVLTVCIGVISILVFRMVIFKSYPAEMKSIYFTDALTEYYNETDGEIRAKTQVLRTPYDNPKFANFMCDYLILVEGAEELQISVRYNDSMIAEAESKYNLTGLVAGDENLLSFRLVNNEGKVLGILAYKKCADRFMYNYVKLAFSGVELGDSKWVRLEVFINAADSEDAFAMIPVYENHEGYNVFTDYVLQDNERPEND